MIILVAVSFLAALGFARMDVFGGAHGSKGMTGAILNRLEMQGIISGTDYFHEMWPMLASFSKVDSPLMSDVVKQLREERFRCQGEEPIRCSKTVIVRRPGNRLPNATLELEIDDLPVPTVKGRIVPRK
jgi:hypothetical protein